MSFLEPLLTQTGLGKQHNWRDVAIVFYLQETPRFNSITARIVDPASGGSMCVFGGHL